MNVVFQFIKLEYFGKTIKKKKEKYKFTIEIIDLVRSRKLFVGFLKGNF